MEIDLASAQVDLVEGRDLPGPGRHGHALQQAIHVVLDVHEVTAVDVARYHLDLC